MNEVIRAAAALQAACEAERWRFCFIGGLAVQRWGQPRETVDVDLMPLTGFRDEARFAETLIARFEPRIPDPLAFALTRKREERRPSYCFMLERQTTERDVEADARRSAQVTTPALTSS